MADYMQIALDAIRNLQAEHEAEIKRLQAPQPADLRELMAAKQMLDASALHEASHVPIGTIYKYLRQGAKQFDSHTNNLGKLAKALEQQPATVLCALRRTYDARKQKGA